MNSIGDLASLMMSTRRQSSLRLEADSSGQAATTGLAQDKSKHLMGNTMSLSLIDRKISLLKQQVTNTAEASLLFSSVQSVLNTISGNVTDLSNDLSLASQFENTSDFERLSEQASNKFASIVDTINTRVASRYAFSGAAVDTQPLPNGQTLLSELQLTVTGITDASSLSDALDTWFDDPAGLYQTIYFRGSETASIVVPIDDQQSIELSLNANDDIIRNMLKGIAKTALLSKITAGDSTQEYQAITTQSYSDLTNVNAFLVSQQGSIGVLEASIQDSANDATLQISQLEQKKLDYIGVDQFSEAARFEALLQQLDVTYRIAARKSEVSLAAYLR